MAMSHVELYEALKDSVGEKAARLMADVFPAAEDLARKDDIARVLLAISELKAQFIGEFGRVEGEFGKVEGEFGTVKAEFGKVEGQFGEVKAEFGKEFGSVRADIKEESKQMMRWMLGFFVPLWIATWGTLLAVLLKH